MMVINTLRYFKTALPSACHIITFFYKGKDFKLPKRIFFRYIVSFEFANFIP